MATINKETLLITWWLWYIWSHAVVAFEQQWYSVIIVDNLSNTDIWMLEWIEKILWYKPEFYNYDLRDKEGLEIIFDKYDFDGVLHFAWLKSVWDSCKNTWLYLDNNIWGSLVLFKCMEEYGVTNIIFSSSATVYNYDNGIPYTEDMPTWKTINPYAHTKYSIEKILENLSKFSDFKVISLRYFNPIGAHESWLIWENPKGIPNNLLPYVMKVAVWGLPTLQVFWDDYNTIDGTWVRDYIDVNDLIEWHIKAYELLEKTDKKNIYEAINLGVGKGVSVLEILKICEEVVWGTISYKITERRKWDLWEFYCDSWKAKKILWWESKTWISESIKNGWNFYKHQVWR